MSIPATAEFDPREPAAPPDWPRTTESLTIALLGWARLSYQATQGSGYNLSASELAAGLAMSGHRVLYLASGRKYNLVPWAYISGSERWRGIECFDLINSPNLSPAAYNFTNMPCERRSRRTTSLVLRWLRQAGVQVVHVHSLEGFPLELIRAVRESGVPVVVTPHNYWYACPQVDLMYQERGLCLDYEGGRRCESCMRRRTPWVHRLKRRVGQAIESVVGQDTTGAARILARALVKRARTLSGRVAPSPPPNARTPDPESASGLQPRDGIGSDGLIRTNLAKEASDHLRKPVAPTTFDANEQFLRADHHLTVLNDYGRRRSDGVAALGSASAVIPPSDYVRRVYVRMGLDERHTRVVRLGQPHFDQIHRRAKRHPYYSVRPWDPHTSNRPLRLAFLGAMRPSKGIDVLADAIGLLPKEVRQQCQFHIRALGFDWPLRKRLSVFPEVAFGGGYDILQLLGETGEYDVGLLPHVWLENSPLVLLEHLHAGKFVISSRLGGVVEWLDPPRNGLLCAGGRADELASCIQQLVSGRVTIPSPREVHAATPILQSYPDHIREVEAIYAGLVAGRSLSEIPGPSTQTHSHASLSPIEVSVADRRSSAAATSPRRATTPR